jgi:hypothetical protein
VTVTVSDKVYRQAQRIARATGHDVAETLAKMLELSLGFQGLPTPPANRVRSLSDSEVLALSESQMESEQDRRLSDLLYIQQARPMTEAERLELQTLMRIYEDGLLRKAQALAEAVRRGLRGPLES